MSQLVNRVGPGLGMSASPPTPDVSLQGNEPPLRAWNRLMQCSKFDGDLKGQFWSLDEATLAVSGWRGRLTG
jgi:hypothetical protein